MSELKTHMAAGSGRIRAGAAARHKSSDAAAPDAAAAGSGDQLAVVASGFARLMGGLDMRGCVVVWTDETGGARDAGGVSEVRNRSTTSTQKLTPPALSTPALLPSASQLAARMITFGMNLLVARHLTPEAYGVSELCWGRGREVNPASRSFSSPQSQRHRPRIALHTRTPTRIPTRAPPQLSAVQFYLITTTALLLSREGFRRGCMRVRKAEPAKVR